MKRDLMIPKVTFRVRTGDEVETDGGCAIGGQWINKTTDDFFKGKRAVLFSLPGAFTPTCHRNHLPGYLDNYDALKSKGVDEIICFSTNDIFVNSAWIQSLGAAEKVIMLSDSKAEFSKALGTDYSDPFGTSIKTQRFSMYLVDSVIRELFIEQESGQALLSGALNMIDSI